MFRVLDWIANGYPKSSNLNKAGMETIFLFKSEAKHIQSRHLDPYLVPYVFRLMDMDPG